MENVRDFERFNEDVVTKAFSVSIGRLASGFQTAAYDAADRLKLDIDIKKTSSGLFEVDYRIKISGEREKMQRFLNWIKSLENN